MKRNRLAQIDDATRANDTKHATPHTPGPWRLTDDQRIRRVVKGGSPERSIVVIEDWTKDADAKLIAAAPALLAAAQALVKLDTVPGIGHDHPFMVQARAAIAAATVQP